MLLFKLREDNLYSIYINNDIKPRLGYLSNIEAGQGGVWCFCGDNAFILTEELIEIVDKLKELNAGRAINNQTPTQ